MMAQSSRSLFVEEAWGYGRIMCGCEMTDENIQAPLDEMVYTLEWLVGECEIGFTIGFTEKSQKHILQELYSLLDYIRKPDEA